MPLSRAEMAEGSAASAATAVGLAALNLDHVQAALSVVIGVLSIVVLVYTVGLKRREWRNGRRKDPENL